MLGYLAYEILHACEHLPEQHPISKLPWVRQMRRLHELHHARDLMHRFNFNVVLPLWDWIYGTMYWESDSHIEDRRKMILMQHHYPVEIKGPSGSLSAGAEFEYTGGRAGHLLWNVIEYVPGRRWQARARGKYGLVMLVTYECEPVEAITQFTRTLEYRFSHVIGRLANHFFLHKRIEKDSANLLDNLSTVAEKVIPAHSPSPSR